MERDGKALCVVICRPGPMGESNYQTEPKDNGSKWSALGCCCWRKGRGSTESKGHNASGRPSPQLERGCGLLLQPPGRRHTRVRRGTSTSSCTLPSPDRCLASSVPLSNASHEGQGHSLGQQPQWLSLHKPQDKEQDSRETGNLSRNLSIQKTRRGTC